MNTGMPRGQNTIRGGCEIRYFSTIARKFSNPHNNYMTTQQANELGRNARRNETAKAPAQDAKFMAMMDWKAGGKAINAALAAWNEGFQAEHLTITQPAVDSILGGAR